MLDITELRIKFLARRGFYAKGIIALVKKYDGEDFSPSAIYAVCRKAGIKLRDYRYGLTEEAEHVASEFGRKSAKKAV